MKNICSDCGLDKFTFSHHNGCQGAAKIEANMLRFVEIIGGHRLMTWDTHKRFETGQHKIGYAFWKSGDSEPLFFGEDQGVAPSYAIDSDDATIGVLFWFGLKHGDTDADFFKDYNEKQLSWSESQECQDLAMYVSDYEENDEIELIVKDIEL